MRKSTRIVKRILALFLVVLLSIESFCAVVGDNDGSAFITKAEFDSLKNDFQNQIDQYNTSIDSKIDGAIASYLAGINVSKSKMKNPLCSSIYEPNITFHGKNDAFGYPRLDVDGQHGYNIYNFLFNYFMMVHDRTNKKIGARLIQHRTTINDNIFEFIINGAFRDNKYYISSWAENANITLIAYNYSPDYGTSSTDDVGLHWAWRSSTWYYGVNPRLAQSFGNNMSSYVCWPDTNSTHANYSYDEINVDTQPTWASGSSYQDAFAWKANMLSELDDGDYKSKLKHFWTDVTTTKLYGVMRRKINLNKSDPVIIALVNWKQRWESYSLFNAVGGVRSANVAELQSYGYTIFNDNAGVQYTDYYGPAIFGRRGYDNTHERYTQNTGLNPNEVYYTGYDNEEYTLTSAPFFDILDENIEKLSYKIKLEDNTNLDDGWLYMSTERYDTETATDKFLYMKKNDEQTSAQSIKLSKGVEYIITIGEELPKGTKIFFKIVPDTESGRVVIDNIYDYTIFT